MWLNNFTYRGERSVRRCIIDQLKLVMKVPKFIASFCHPNYRLSSVLFTSWKRKVFAFLSVVYQRCNVSNSMLSFVKLMLIQRSSTQKNTYLLHWLVSLSQVLTWYHGEYRGKIYGVIFFFIENASFFYWIVRLKLISSVLVRFLVDIAMLFCSNLWNTLSV